MKSMVFGLAAVLFAGNAFAQTAPAPAADAQATQQADTQQQGDTQQAETQQTTPAANGAQVPTVPVQTPKKTNTASIVLGAVGAAALLGAASNSGGGDEGERLNPTPSPSSP